MLKHLKMLKKLIDVKDVKCKRANSLKVAKSELIITQLLPLVTIHKCADLDGRVALHT